MESFGEWLSLQLNERRWRQADLARAANLDSAVISNLVNGRRGPGEDTCRAIAHAFGLPAESIYRAAGLLPELPTMDEAMREILEYKLGELTLAQREEVLRFIEFIRERDEDREGATPPERLRRRVRT